MITPGLFVRVRVALERRADALLVPERALGRDQRGPYLLVVDAKDAGRAARRQARLDLQAGSLPELDTAMGDFRVVEEGLAAADLVIVDGIQKARPDMPAKPTRKDVAIRAVADASPVPKPAKP